MKADENSSQMTDAALKLMVSLNKQNVSVEYGILGEKYLVSKVHPISLIMPEGWHFSKGAIGRKLAERDKCIACLTPSGLLWQGVVIPE